MKINQKFFGKDLANDRNRYLKILFAFFSELGIEEDYLVNMLNKKTKKFFHDLLHVIIFYQYAEKVIDERDDIIRPVLLICLIDAIEDKKLQLIQKLENFFCRLDNEDKIYLIDRIKKLTKYRGKINSRKLYHDLIIRHRIYKNFARDAIYKDVDPQLKYLNRYIKKLAVHLYGIRNYVLHESRQVLYAMNMDEELNILPSSLFNYKADKKIGITKKKIKKGFMLWSNIAFLEYRKIIKRGVIIKLKIN
jgi:hypothetical protein